MVIHGPWITYQPVSPWRDARGFPHPHHCAQCQGVESKSEGGRGPLPQGLYFVNTGDWGNRSDVDTSVGVTIPVLAWS